MGRWDRNARLTDCPKQPQTQADFQSFQRTDCKAQARQQLAGYALELFGVGLRFELILSDQMVFRRGDLHAGRPGGRRLRRGLRLLRHEGARLSEKPGMQPARLFESETPYRESGFEQSAGARRSSN